MKILLVSSGSGSRGGGEIFLDYLGKGLAERGHAVVVWMPQHPRMDELAEKCARFGQVVRADYRNTYDHKARSLATCFNWNTSRRIAREWEGLQPDAIHLNKQNLEDGLDLLRAARQCRVPSICTIHLTQTAAYLRAKSAGVRDFIARATLEKYRGIFVTVQETRRADLENFLAGRVCTQTIYNGVLARDRSVLPPLRAAKRKELGLNDRDFLVLGLGRLVEQKRPFEFLKIAQKLRVHFPAAKFLWVGDGALLAPWKDWVAREKLESVISCAGWQADALPFLAAGDLLLHVAEYEGLPLAIIEAMATGLPCAVTRNFASEIELFDESNVIFFDQPENLAEKLKDSIAMAGVAEKAHRLVRNQLSLENMINAYEQLYSKVMTE